MKHITHKKPTFKVRYAIIDKGGSLFGYKKEPFKYYGSKKNIKNKL